MQTYKLSCSEENLLLVEQLTVLTRLQIITKYIKQAYKTKLQST